MWELSIVRPRPQSELAFSPKRSPGGSKLDPRAAVDARITFAREHLIGRATRRYQETNDPVSVCLHLAPGSQSNSRIAIPAGLLRHSRGNGARRLVPYSGLSSSRRASRTHENASESEDRARGRRCRRRCRRRRDGEADSDLVELFLSLARRRQVRGRGVARSESSSCCTIEVIKVLTVDNGAPYGIPFLIFADLSLARSRERERKKERKRRRERGCPNVHASRIRDFREAF